VADEYSGPNEDDAQVQALLVLNNLVVSLAQHFNLSKSSVRAVIRRALQEL
jgi:Mor family transcriptional regulator